MSDAVAVTLSASAPPRGPGRAFDLAVALLSGWLVGGTYLDAWAHHNVAGLETFFSPWHAVLYAGFLAVAAVVAAPLLAGRGLGRAVPDGYRPALAGVLLFFVGGAGDAAWHILFGIEADLEALLSPTHLLLAAGAGLIVSAPLRAAWRRPDSGAPLEWPEALPQLLSLAWTLSLLTFFTEYANPLAVPWPSPAQQTDPPVLGESLGVAAILVYSALLVGATLPVVSRWDLPPGGLTLALGLNAALTVWAHGEFHLIAPAVLAGLVGDLLHAATGGERRGTLRIGEWQVGGARVHAIVVPVVLYAAYFGALAATSGVAWSVHLWAGSIALAGAAGWLMSLRVLPSPPAPARPLEAPPQRVP